MTPKYQLNCTVEVFAKLFLSAEPVESLVGSHGVEDQFCNRMSMIRGEGTIESRPKFIEVGSDKYCESIANYIARKFNEKVNDLLLMGRDEATKFAGEQLAKFHSKCGIAKHFGKLSDSIDQIANEILNDFLRSIPTYQSCTLRGLKIGLCRGRLIMKSPAKIIDEWISNHLSPAEQIMIRKKKNEIMRALSVSNQEGPKNHHCCIAKQTIKGVRLKTTDGLAADIIQRLKESIR